MLLLVGDTDENEQPENGEDSASLARANELLYLDPRAALDLLKTAVASEGARSALLWPKARAQFLLHEHDQALETLNEAARLEPSPARKLSERINVLSDAGLVRQALAAVDAVPADLRDDPGVHVAMESFYTKWQFFAHAFVLGPSSAPVYFSRADDRVFWYVGGPLVRHWPRLRRWALSLENDKLLDAARQELPHLADLGQASGLRGSALTALRASLDAAQVRLRYRLEAWHVVSRLTWRIRSGVVLAVWPALWFAATRLPRTDRPRAVALPSLTSAIIAVLVALLASRLTREAPIWWRLTRSDGLVRMAVLVAAGIGAGEAYAHRLVPPAGWQFWTEYGLIAAPAATALMAFVLGLFHWRMFWAWRQTMRDEAHFDIIDDLLWLRHELREPGLRSGATRLFHARLLDKTASNVQQYLLPPKSTGGLSAKSWLDERAEGWAQALRQSERALVAESRGQTEKTARFLSREINCLATGHFGSLAWEAPNSAPKRLVRDRLLPEARNLLVALLPLAAVLCARLLVHLSGGVLTGALLTTGAWAVLTVMNRLDPELDKKLASAQQLNSALRQTPRAGGGAEPPRG